MSDTSAEVASLLLHQVSRLLERLDPAQIRDLVAGRCRLAVVTTAAVADTGAAPHPLESPDLGLRAGVRSSQETLVGSPAPEAGSTARGVARAGREIDAESIRATIMTMASREEAASYVGTLGTVAVLRGLAGELGVRLSAKDRRPDIIRKVVDGTLGAVLTARAIRGDTAG
ncbi:hypothetical protein Ga0074812_11824 [Parafrankia irregularis]|uniref:Uncharacterized protein n=1 Tax=Parafrankia irregularis TaxID=795642 RepID=A0A0S4QTT6_9ACTN|nr:MULTISPECIES: hypothetical protein [Parafrankia]MBE3201773.1 hypothetical protein [Parafrankia sp. CH37]CUU58252.1 hypothetical protein Ga0074812_11824 [Parafrankia irregularis]